MRTRTTYKYIHGITGVAWQATCDSAEGLPTASGIGNEDWVRLIPVDSLELAAASPPLKPLLVDRKRAPAVDLTGGLPGRDLVASERFVRALERSGASGYRATVVPHATPNRVRGHILYVLTVDGFAGEIVDTKLVKLGFEPPPPTDPRLFLNRTPMSPVTIDASVGSGDDVCLSQWLGAFRGDWRALIVRGDVYRRLVADLDPPVFGAERVITRGVPERMERAPGVVHGSGEHPADPPSGHALVALLREEASRYGHELPPPADDAALSRIETLAGFPLPRAYSDFMRATDGATLFRGSGLRFFYERGGNFSLAVGVEWTREAPEGSYRSHDEWFAIAATENDEIVWVIDREGLIRGLGQEGIVYGPDAPFEGWLADQIADLRWAADRQRS